jgi:hypothetical protein
VKEPQKDDTRVPLSPLKCLVLIFINLSILLFIQIFIVHFMLLHVQRLVNSLSEETGSATVLSNK